jgi:hypothetical protein
LSAACAGFFVAGAVVWPGSGASAAAQEEGPPYFERVAGTGEVGSSGDGQAATDASIGQDPDIAVGPDGTLYIADGERVRAVNRDGVITTVPGTGPASEGGGSSGVAVGPDGALYVAGDETVRQVGRNGSVTWTADIDVELYPDSIAVDGSGNVYLSGDGIVVRIGRDATTRTIGGGGKLDPVAAEGKPATEANLGDLLLGGVAVDAVGTVYLTVPSFVLPPNNGARLLRIDRNGTLHTVAGAGDEGFSGDGGPAVRAQVGGILNAPAVDGDGNVYFFDQENLLVRVVGSDGAITSLAALPPVPGEVAERLGELAVGPGDELYVSAESVVYRLMRGGRSWTAGPAREPNYPARFPEAEPGTVHTVAGSGRSAEISEPTGREVGKPATEVTLRGDARSRRMAVDHDGALLVADSRSGLFAVARDGTFDQPFTIDDTNGYWVTRTGLWPAEAVAVGPDGSRFVAASGVVYHLAQDKQLVPVAGHGEQIRDHDRIEEGRPATLSQFAGIFDLAVGPNGMLYIVTYRGVYRLDGDGTLSPVFRRAHHTVQAVAVDGEDRVYVAATDHGSPGSGVSGHLYRVDPGAEPTVIAGNGEAFSADIEEGAKATDVALGIASDVAVDDDGTVYLGTVKGVLQVDTDETVHTVANDTAVTSLVLDRHGDLYFAGEEHGQVKVLVQPGELSGPFPWVTVSGIAAGVVVLAAAGWFGLRRRRGGSEGPPAQDATDGPVGID